MKYSVVFFDADDTLYDFKKSQEVAFRKTISHFQISYHTDALYSEYKRTNRELWVELEKNTITEDDLKILRFKRIFDAHKIKQDASDFSKVYIEYLSHCNHLQPTALNICEYLKNKGVKIGIITNGFKDVQTQRFSTSPLFSYFDNVTISEECGFKKPDSRIFQCALNKFIGVEKSQILMVGDNLTADIGGGSKFGLDTCWFHPKGGEPHADIKPTYIIKCLSELKNIIKN